MQYLGSALPFFHDQSKGMQLKQSATVAEIQNATTAASAIYICTLKGPLMAKMRWRRSRRDSLVVQETKKYSTVVENVILTYRTSAGVKT